MNLGILRLPEEKLPELNERIGKILNVLESFLANFKELTQEERDTIIESLKIMCTPITTYRRESE